MTAERLGHAALQAAALERRVGELEDEVGQLAAAAQAAEEQAVQLMQQVQAANAAEAEAARESSALAGQVCSRRVTCMHPAAGVKVTVVRTGWTAAEVVMIPIHLRFDRSCSAFPALRVQVQALEQQASELSTLLGRQSGDVATQPQQSARRALFARRSLGSLDGTSTEPTPGASISGGSEFVPSDAGSEGGDGAEAAAAGDQDASADVDGAAGTTPAPGPTADDAAAWPKAELLHPLAQPEQAAPAHTAEQAAPSQAAEQAAPSQTAEQAAPSQTAESPVPVDAPQMRATLRSDSQLQHAGSGGVDSPSRHQFDGASAAVCACRPL